MTKKPKCPSSVPALTNALARAKQKAKVEAAKKKAALKVLASLKKKKSTASAARFDRAAKKLKAIWQ